jgi:methylated-DNA-[protein]-cysteine S-methyltransferase
MEETMTLTISQIDSPVGQLHFATTDRALVALRFDAKERGVAGDPLGVGNCLQRYFKGELHALDELAIEFQEGTEFQRAVWTALRQVPVGETWSYQQLAKAIGRPRAVRAVGAANGQNPIALVLPCHRVIGKSGELRGYGGGLDRKRWLLRHEAGAKPECLHCALAVGHQH